jgi:hypothetical protein
MKVIETWLLFDIIRKDSVINCEVICCNIKFDTYIVTTCWIEERLGTQLLLTVHQYIERKLSDPNFFHNAYGLLGINADKVSGGDKRKTCTSQWAEGCHWPHLIASHLGSTETLDCDTVGATPQYTCCNEREHRLKYAFAIVFILSVGGQHFVSVYLSDRHRSKLIF